MLPAAHPQNHGEPAPALPSPQPRPQRQWISLPPAVWMSCLLAVVCVAAALMVAMDHPWVAFLSRHPAKASPPPPAPATGAMTASAPAANTVTAETRARVAALKIGGTIRGARLQVMIDGTLFAAGEVVDPASELMVMTIDEEKRRVIFIDRAGQTYTRTW